MAQQRGAHSHWLLKIIGKERLLTRTNEAELELFIEQAYRLIKTRETGAPTRFERVTFALGRQTSAMAS